MADSLPSSVIRAKGFFEAEGIMYIFSYVMGDWTIEDPGIPAERIKHKNTVVFIGPIDSMEGIGKAAEKGNWTKGEISSHKTLTLFLKSRPLIVMKDSNNGSRTF